MRIDQVDGMVTALPHLERAAERVGLDDLVGRLRELERWTAAELIGFERELDAIPRGAREVERAAAHLLDLKGKHLRPMCVVLASKLGSGFDDRARQLALAVEMVHTATLLHDDVVDVAEQRRGRAAARVVYSNAASIFAGDWLLVLALRRIAAVDGTLLDRMLAVIESMILAESIQLERRGRVCNAGRDGWMQVVDGKTAALFSWAMIAGGRAGGLDDAALAALDGYGRHLGIAFQTIDDCLDIAGDPTATGKDALADLREGKLTYPILIGLEREPSFAARLDEILAAAEADGAVDPDAAIEVATVLSRTGGLLEARRLAAHHVERALDALTGVPAGAGRDALATVAEASLRRSS
jgi:octaprenyl-diphosphate synthase